MKRTLNPNLVWENSYHTKSLFTAVLGVLFVPLLAASAKDEAFTVLMGRPWRHLFYNVPPGKEALHRNAF